MSETHSISSTPQSQAEPPTVFVVDDEDGVRSLLVRTVSLRGHQGRRVQDRRRIPGRVSP